MRKKIFLTLLLLFAMSLISLPKTVDAVGVTPMIVDEVKLDPGQSKIIDFTVLSDNPEDKTYYFYTQNFGPDGKEMGGQIFLTEDLPDSADLAAWISFPEKSIVVTPMGEAQAKAIITVPEDAEAGSHHAVIWTTEKDPETGDTVSVEGNIGILVVINVSGDIKEEAEIMEFNYIKKFQNRLPVDFWARVKNNGNVYFRPTGEVIIRNIFGKEMTRVSANPRNAMILRNDIRRIEGIQWVKNSDILKGGFFTEMRNEWRNFAFGPYKAELNMIYGSNGASVVAKTKYVWVFPWRLFLVLVLIFLALFIYMKYYKHSVLKQVARNDNKKALK